jgi:hypothetical protein
LFQFLWVFTSPMMAPGPGSKDAGNSYIAGAAASNQIHGYHQ